VNAFEIRGVAGELLFLQPVSGEWRIDTRADITGKSRREREMPVSGELLFRIPEDFRPARFCEAQSGRSFHPLQRPCLVAPRESSVW
jgi:hypothetical protein